MRFYHNFFYWLGNVIQDIGAFLRFGLKTKTKCLWQWTCDRFYMFRLWRESLPASRKARRHQTRQELRNVWDHITLVPIKLMDFAWQCISAPREVMAKIREEWDYLRSLSLKGMIVSAWNSYVALVTALVAFLGGLYERWLSTRPLMKALMIIVLICLISVAATFGWLIQMAKSYRADQLIAEADSLQAQEYEIKSYQKLRSAALLKPDDREILERAMETAHKLHTPEAVWWGQQIIKRSDQSAKAYSTVVQYAIDFNQTSVGAEFLAQLKAKHPDANENIDAELILLLSQGRPSRALALATQYLEEGKETPLAHEVYLKATPANSPETKAKLHEHHLKNLYRDDEIGLHLCRLALKSGVPDDPDATLFDYPSILKHLQTMDEANREDRIMAIGRAHEAGQIDREEAISTILDQYDLVVPDERIEAFRALNFFKIGGVDDRLMQPNDLMRHRELCNELMRMLILSDRPDLERARSLSQLHLKSSALSMVDKHFWRSFIHLTEGDQDQYIIELTQALTDASQSDWKRMEHHITTYTGLHQQLVFYRELYGLTDNNAYSTKRYLELLYYLGRDYELKSVLAQVPLEPFRQDPIGLSLIIYLKASYGLSLEQCRYFAENLVEKFPEMYPCYISLSFAYWQSGHKELAKSLLAGIPNHYQPDSMPIYQRFAFAIVTGQAEYAPPDPSLATLPPEKAYFEAKLQSNVGPPL